jgi:hypothetical protein
MRFNKRLALSLGDGGASVTKGSWAAATKLVGRVNKTFGGRLKHGGLAGIALKPFINKGILAKINVWFACIRFMYFAG